MKVALLCENYYPTLGGIQEHVYNVAESLRLAGIDAHVITGLPGIAETKSGAARKRVALGRNIVQGFDWKVLTGRILATYEDAIRVGDAHTGN